MQSVGNKTHDISDLINNDRFDILAVAETWLSSYDNAKIREMTPVTHTFLHVPRLGKRGGGVGLFVSNIFKKIKVDKVETWNSFEHMQVSCEVGGRKFIFIVVYRPPGVNAVEFLADFSLYLEAVDSVSGNVFILGDFNLWVDDADNRHAADFIEMMSGFDFVNKVTTVTTSTGHMLDLVFCDARHDLLQNVCVDEVCSISPIHRLVRFEIPFLGRREQRIRIRFRVKEHFEPENFIDRVIQRLRREMRNSCEHDMTEVENCVQCISTLYNHISKEEYEVMCPEIEKDILVKDHAPWFNSEISRAKMKKRKKEQIWRRLRTDNARRDYQNARNEEKRLIAQRKRHYYSSKVKEAGTDINKLYLILNNLTGNKKKPRLPEGYSDEVLEVL